MSHERPSRANRRSRGRRAALVGTYVASIALGYALGNGGVVPSVVARGAPLSAQARVGFALGQTELAGSEAAWEQLSADVRSVRRSWDPESQNVYDLVVAVRGLETRGTPNLQRASELCANLHWRRCDEQSLRELASRSRP